MVEPLVSVIIPTYNRLEYVQQTIDSVLAQTHPNIEVLVIDDGSTDGSRDILPRKYTDKIRYHWQENQGESVARNLGIELSRGDFVAFLDSDDLWHPEKISILVAELEKDRNQHAVAACSSVWLIDSQGRQLNSTPIGRATKLPRRKLTDFLVGPRIYAPPSNMLIRKRALQAAGNFEAAIQYGEDWDLVIRLRSLGEILYVDMPLLYYRQHATQQGIPKPEKIEAVLRDHLLIIDKNSTRMHSVAAEAIHHARALLFEKAACWCFALELVDQGFTYLEQVALLQPKMVNPLRLSQNLGHWVAVGAFERLGSLEMADEYFLKAFLPIFFERGSLHLHVLPNAKQLTGWYYHNLAYLCKNSNVKQKKHFLYKSVQSQLMLAFSGDTFCTLLLSGR